MILTFEPASDICEPSPLIIVVYRSSYIYGNYIYVFDGVSNDDLPDNSMEMSSF
jgi:hypothetical protein